MSTNEGQRLWQRGQPFLPPEGVLRVHRDPTRLPPDVDRAVQPPHRFDDAEHDYYVQYCATTLRGCLVEVFAWFREDAAAKALLHEVEGADDEVMPPLTIPSAWLRAQRIARAFLHEDGRQDFIDATDPTVLSRFNSHKLVRVALEESLVGEPAGQGQRRAAMALDESTIRLPGPRGRMITQAFSRAVYESSSPHPSGIRYTSRLDITEEAWAAFPGAIIFEDGVRQLGSDPADLEAAESAAAVVGVSLPDDWPSALDEDADRV